MIIWFCFFVSRVQNIKFTEVNLSTDNSNFTKIQDSELTEIVCLILSFALLQSATFLVNLPIVRFLQCLSLLIGIIVILKL